MGKLLNFFHLMNQGKYVAIIWASKKLIATYIVEFDPAQSDLNITAFRLARAVPGSSLPRNSLIY
jgi:hypothetical protein